MLGYHFNEVSEAFRMCPDSPAAAPVAPDHEQSSPSVTATNPNAPILGAVTIARSVNVCSQHLMTASNPAANAAAAAVPAYVVVKYGR